MWAQFKPQILECLSASQHSFWIHVTLRACSCVSKLQLHKLPTSDNDLCMQAQLKPAKQSTFSAPSFGRIASLTSSCTAERGCSIIHVQHLQMWQAFSIPASLFWTVARWCASCCRHDVPFIWINCRHDVRPNITDKPAFWHWSHHFSILLWQLPGAEAQLLQASNAHQTVALYDELKGANFHKCEWMIVDF